MGSPVSVAFLCLCILVILLFPFYLFAFFFHIGRGRRDPKELQARDVGAAQTRHVAVVQLCRFPGKAHARGKAASIEKRSANDAAKYTEATL